MSPLNQILSLVGVPTVEETIPIKYVPAETVELENVAVVVATVLHTKLVIRVPEVLLVEVAR